MSTARYSIVIRGNVDAATLERLGKPEACAERRPHRARLRRGRPVAARGAASSGLSREGLESQAQRPSTRRPVPAAVRSGSRMEPAPGHERGPCRGGAGHHEDAAARAAPGPRAPRAPALNPAIRRTRTLTLVDAPAGSGKTTALAQWPGADGDRLSACWFSVDPSDNDPTRFWTYAITAMREAILGFGDASLAASRGGADVATFVLPPAINELAAAERASRLSLTTTT